MQATHGIGKNDTCTIAAQHKSEPDEWETSLRDDVLERALPTEQVLPASVPTSVTTSEETVTMNDGDSWGELDSAPTAVAEEESATRRSQRPRREPKYFGEWVKK